MALDKPENATAATIVLKSLTGLEFDAVAHEHGIFYSHRNGHLDVLISPSGAGWAWHDQDGRWTRGRDLKELVNSVCETLLEELAPQVGPWGVQVGRAGEVMDVDLATDTKYAPVFVNDKQARYLVRAMNFYTGRADNVKEYEVKMKADLDFRVQQARRSMS